MATERQPAEAVTYDKDGGDRENVTAEPAAEDAEPPPPDMGAARAASPPRRRPDAAMTPEDHADDLADAIYDRFMLLSVRRMEKNGGKLTRGDLETMGKEFKAQLCDIKRTFLEAVETYAIAPEKVRIRQDREQNFLRIMVRRCENRLVDDATLKREPNRLSRRMLPVFKDMLAGMIGPAKMRRYAAQSDAVVAEMTRRGGGRVDWSELHASPEARRIALIAQVEIAGHFEDASERLDRMVAMVNRTLMPPDDHAPEEAWTFTREAAQALLTDLFGDLREALKDAGARARFTDQLGDEGVAVLDRVAARFGG